MYFSDHLFVYFIQFFFILIYECIYLFESVFNVLYMYLFTNLFDQTLIYGFNYLLIRIVLF